jgi:glycosyltransferase involved in cell wall biosynthesis
MRYSYVKHGDAVDQVRRLLANRQFDGSGPDAFIGDFLRARVSDDVLVLCRATHGEQYRSDRIAARSFPGDRAHGFGMIGRVWSALRIGWTILRWKPDRIVCGCTGELLWVCVITAKMLRVPIVNSRHGELQERKGLGSLVSRLDRASIRACHAVVCHGPFMADQILQIGVRRSRVFDFEVDLATFADPPPDTPDDRVAKFVVGRTFIFTFIGRVQRDKGVMDLLEAFSRLRVGGRQVGLIYAGDGADHGALTQRVQELGCANDVLMLGRVVHSKLAQVIKLSTAVVCPTRPEFPEGRCMVVLEALVLGVPVVAPRSGPFPYAIVDQSNGLLFSPGSAQALQQSLEMLISDAAGLDRMRLGARASAAELLAVQRSFSQALAAAFGDHPFPKSEADPS